MNDRSLGDAYGRLREAFDRSFAEPVQTGAAEIDDLLAIRVGDDPYALRLSEIGGLFANRRIAPLPTSTPALLGIAGMRGVLVPVYDLRQILGYAANGAPRWLALAAHAVVGFAFDRFDAHLRIPRQSFAPEHGANGLVREIARAPTIPPSTLPVIHLPSVLQTIESQAANKT